MKARNVEKTSRKTAKKAIIIVFLTVLVSMVVLYCILLAIQKRSDSEKKQPNNYRFDYVNYDEDIFGDKEYMSYDRNVYYTSVNSYMTVSIERDSLDDVSEAYKSPVLFMLDYIDAMINGEADTFNAYHAPEFYTNGRTPLERFTMQKLYSITITAVDNWYDDSGAEAVRYYNMGIDYMIKNNNGTLRNDMGSDAIRRKYLTLRETADGTITIIDESYFSRLEDMQG